MRPVELALAFTAGLALYLLTFMFVVSKPVTLGTAGRYVEYKAHYLSGLRGQKKILIFAGSNGRYSHRCETISAMTQIPCANLATAAGSDLRWMMADYWQFMEKGDVLYMPLEYWPDAAHVPRVGNEAPYIVRHRHDSLGIYAPGQLAAALFYFDFRFFVSSLGEMLLARMGYQPRTSVLSMTVQGDESGETREKAAAYRGSIESVPPRKVNPEDYANPQLLMQFNAVIDTAQSKGVIVVGGLPTVFEDDTVADAALARIRHLYQGHGACFLELPNRSKYPRSDFFDTADHLQEEFQIAHSSALAPLLAQVSLTSSCLP